MTMTDPIADMLTRIRNANLIGRKSVEMPFSKMKYAIGEALSREGFIDGVTQDAADPKKPTLKVFLKYGPEGEKVITEIKRISKPGRRVYRSLDQIQKVLNGFGAEIYTTNQGILTDRECRKGKVGGEVLLMVR
jgi:small subunit ribosomal protein S8